MKLYPLLLTSTVEVASAWEISNIFNRDFHQNEEILHKQLDRARKIVQKQCAADLNQFSSASSPGKNFVKALNAHGIMSTTTFDETPEKNAIEVHDAESDGDRRLHHSNHHHGDDHHRLSYKCHWHEHGDGHWHEHEHRDDFDLMIESRLPSLGFGGKADACLRMHRNESNPKCNKAISGVDTHHERLGRQIDEDDRQETIYRYATMAICVLSMIASYLVVLLVNNSDEGSGLMTGMERFCLMFNKFLAAALVFVVIFYCPALLLVIAPSFAVVQVGYYMFFHRPAAGDYPARARVGEQYEVVAQQDDDDDSKEDTSNLVFMGVPVDVV